MTDRNKNTSSFAKSLSALEPSGIRVCRHPPKKSLSDVISLVLRIVLILALLSVFFYCVFTLATNMLEYAEAQNYYDDLVESIWNVDGDFNVNPYGDVVFSDRDYLHGTTSDYETAQSRPTDTTVDYVYADTNEMTLIRAKLSALYAQNKDLVAWISIPDTIVNYPVVQAEDNDYYLRRSFKGDYLIAGTIFVDYRNSSTFSENYNTVVYGHNLYSGNMFAPLAQYFSNYFFNRHKEIYLYAMDGIYVYEVFNVSKVSSEDNYIQTSFGSDEEFVQFAYEHAAASSIQVKGLEFNGNDHILTLSTCTNAHDSSERYCIQAKLVEYRTDQG